MRRYAIAAVFLAAACLPAPAQAGAVTGVKVSSCSRFDHSASFYGRMNRQLNAERMAMRFTLLVRGPGDVFTPIKAPGLSRWRKSKPDVRAFGYRQRVRGLADGAFYRVQVDYRWYDRDGEVVRKSRRRSRVCSQAGPLPNLRVRIADAGPTAIAGVWRYRVRVANPGSALAEGVAVRMTVDGSVVDTRTIDTLEAGAFTFLTFRGPPCGTEAQAVVDPDNTVQESDDSDNAKTRACVQ